MKKLLLAVSGTLLLAACLVSGLAPMGRRPMRGLDADGIVSASVHCIPPDTTYTLTREEIEELALSFRRWRSMAWILLVGCMPDRW